MNALPPRNGNIENAYAARNMISAGRGTRQANVRGRIEAV